MRRFFKRFFQKRIVRISVDVARYLFWGTAVDLIRDIAEDGKHFALGGSLFGRRHFLIVTAGETPPAEYPRSTQVYTYETDDEIFAVWFNSVPRSRWKRLAAEGKVISL